MTPLGRKEFNKVSHRVNGGTYTKQIADDFSKAPTSGLLRAKPVKPSIGHHAPPDVKVYCKRFSKTEFLALLGIHTAQKKLQSQQDAAREELRSVVARHHGADIASQVLDDIPNSQLTGGFASRLNQRVAAVVALNELGFKAGSAQWTENLQKLMFTINLKIRQAGQPKDAVFGLEALARECAAMHHPDEAQLRELVIQQVEHRNIYKPYPDARKAAIQAIFDGAQTLPREMTPEEAVNASAQRYEAAMKAMNEMKVHAADPTRHARALLPLPGDPAFQEATPQKRREAMKAYVFRAALQQHFDEVVRQHKASRLPASAPQAADETATAKAAEDADSAALVQRIIDEGYPLNLATLELARKCFQTHRDITPEGLADARLHVALSRTDLTPPQRQRLLAHAITREAQRAEKPTDAFGPTNPAMQTMKRAWAPDAKPGPFQGILGLRMPRLKQAIQDLSKSGLTSDTQLIEACAPWFKALFLSERLLNGLPPAVRDDMRLAMNAIDSTSRDEREKADLRMDCFVKVFGHALIEAIEMHGIQNGQRDTYAQEAARLLRRLILEPTKTQGSLLQSGSTDAHRAARSAWLAFGDLRTRLVAPSA